MSTGIASSQNLRQHRKQQKDNFVSVEPARAKDPVLSQDRVDWVVSFLLSVWSCYIRLWKISQPTSVVFDEVHFGGFASKYINQKFFMDVHPPLAKILITWAAQVVGFDGQFDFKEIGKDYLQAKVPYVQIRAFCALHGIVVVPMAYWTMRTFDFSVATCVLTALMICYENGFVTNNRLILLDSILLCFTAFTLLAWVNLSRQRNAFNYHWWFWLTMTGVGLGLTVSSKWVGLFTIASIGMSVIIRLWHFWGDLGVTNHNFVKHMVAYGVCLMIIPFCIYLAAFKVHFDMLPLSGPGNSFMSPEFQVSLNQVKFPKHTFADIAYGAKIDIRHVDTNGGYLHSHEHDYPGGSHQQQITLYSHIDSNNWWIINKANTDEVNSLEYVKNGDIVRLKHYKTHRRLHTHDVRPITNDEKYQHEVSAYGYKGFGGDANDHWRVEILPYKGPDPNAGNRLRARRSQFRLISVTQNCALFSRKHKLPEWGFKQQEVTCMKDARYPKTIWTIETTETDILPEGSEMATYQQKGFFAKFLELNKVMWDVNKGLSSTHVYASRPKDWPRLKRGISFWSKDELKIYLLGNPLVYMISTACVLSYALLKMCILIGKKRRLELLDTRFTTHDTAAGFFFLCWAFHYFPFNLMHRQLFLHHYMPSLYMAILLTGVFFESLISRLSARIRWPLTIMCVFAIIFVYRIFIPITYAQPWNTKQCIAATWRFTWDFNCKWFGDHTIEP